MKKLIQLFAVLATVGTTLAQTNEIVTLPDGRKALVLNPETPVVATQPPENLKVAPVVSDDAGKLDKQGWELTLGGDGITVNGKTQFALDFSLETNPIKPLRSLWMGFAQSFSWEPILAGSTDLLVEWSWHVWKDLYVNTGYQGGIVYSNYKDDPSYWRHGPEITAQYYVGDNAFIYAQINYDFVTRGDDGVRYSAGIGLAF